MARAYAELSTCRHVGFSAGSIPISAIWEYADRYGLYVETTNHLVSVVLAIDGIYLRRKPAPAPKPTGRRSK